MLAKESFPQGDMVNTGVRTPLTPAEIAAYDAPYPEERYKTGPRRFPIILPIDLDNPARPANLKAWEQLADWQKPVLTLFAQDFVGTAMGPERLISHIPGAKGQDHAGIPDTSFYIIEDAAEELARRTIAFASQ
jgi:haloalkane dehalogenase